MASDVRERNAEPHRAKLEQARAAYDQAAALFLELQGMLDALRAARAAEEAAAVGLADALRMPHPQRFVTCPDVSVGFFAVRDRVLADVESVAHMSDLLRRREL